MSRMYEIHPKNGQIFLEMSLEEIAMKITENAERLFGV